MPRRKKPMPQDSHRLNRSFFTLLLAGASVFAFFVTRFFIVTLLLSALSAGIFYSIHVRLRRLLPKSRWLSAAVSTVAFCLIILVPAGVIGYFTVSNLIGIAETLLNGDHEIMSQLRDFESSLRDFPVFGREALGDLLSGDRLAQVLENAASWILRQLSGVVEDLVRSIVMLLVYLYSLYFFMRDGERILGGIADAIPLQQDDKRAVSQNFLSVTRAVLKSTFIIGGIQGVVGALLYWAVGIEGPLLWGILIMIVSAVPGIGPIVFWLPTAAVLAVLGHYVIAGVVVAVGATVFPLVDELLRPHLIGEDTHLHPVLALAGVLGGLWVFGVVGLLLGPLVVGVAVTLWDIFQRMYQTELDKM